MRKVLSIMALSLSISILSACHFQPIRASDFPDYIRKGLYVEGKETYRGFISNVKNRLRGLKIHLTDRKQASAILTINHYKFTHTQPEITSTALATTYVYKLSVHASLRSAHGKKLFKNRVLASQRSIAQNPRHLYTSAPESLAEKELVQDILAQLYTLLSKETLNPPNLHHEKKHA